MKAQSILETIGNTAHIRLNRMFPNAEVWIKSERSNPGGSIKDRIGLAMIEAAEKDGSLKPGGTIIEPTSGNPGVGLAMVAAVKFLGDSTSSSLDSSARTGRLSCREASNVAEHFLKSLRIVGGKPSPPRPAVASAPVERPGYVSPDFTYQAPGQLYGNSGDSHSRG